MKIKYHSECITRKKYYHFAHFFKVSKMKIERVYLESKNVY